LKEYQKELRERYGVKHLKVFGSYVKGNQKEESDLDLMVSFEETSTLLEFTDLKEYLEGISSHILRKLRYCS